MALITKYGIVLVYRDDTGCPPYIEIFMFHFIFKSDPIFDTSDYFVSSQRACIQQIACSYLLTSAYGVRDKIGSGKLTFHMALSTLISYKVQKIVC